MHIHFVGIGGTAIGPLALIAKQAGYTVSGSDKQASNYIDYLKKQGVNSINIGQTSEQIAATHQENNIDWLVYSSAVAIENPDHPEIVFAKQNGIRATKRDELLNEVLQDSRQKLIAIAGTHGKTTTTAMVVWLFKQLRQPLSYSLGAKVSFGDMGHFDKTAEYFVYECDEYDRNFLAFHPSLSVITGVAYDHHDIFPTEDDYRQAFKDFLAQSKHKIIWNEDGDKLGLGPNDTTDILKFSDIGPLTLPGKVNRQDGWLAVKAVSKITQKPEQELIEIMNRFPGVSRRFEKVTENLYTDYAHTPEKIAGCLDLAREKSQNVVVIYEPLTNKRQYEVKDKYNDLFEGVKKLYWVPSYLTREDPSQHVLTPKELIENMGNKEIAEPSELNIELKQKITEHLANGDLVVCISGGGGGSLDEWVRENFS
jgi:UDP-N-acetylmuramate--alanine ligase